MPARPPRSARPKRPWAAALPIIGALTVLLAGLAPAGTSAQDPKPTATPYASPTPPPGAAGQMVDILSRFGYFNPESVEVEVMVAPPAFWCATGFWTDALAMGADQYLTIVATQWHHGIFEGRPEQFVPILQLDGTSFHVPVHYHLLADDGHRRTTGMVFGDLPLAVLDEPHRLELFMPATPDGVRGSVGWDTPFDDLPQVDMGQCEAGPARTITASHDHDGSGF